jgi:hypothetical protein
MILYWVLLACAALCFGFAAFNISTPRLNFTALGLLFATIAELGRTLSR